MYIMLGRKDHGCLGLGFCCPRAPRGSLSASKEPHWASPEHLIGAEPGGPWFLSPHRKGSKRPPALSRNIEVFGRDPHLWCRCPSLDDSFDDPARKEPKNKEATNKLSRCSSPFHGGTWMNTEWSTHRFRSVGFTHVATSWWTNGS